MSDAALHQLLTDIDKGVLVTVRRDGRPQLSNVVHTYDSATGVLRVSVTDSRAKTRNLRNDPRASYHVTSADFWQWAVADGTAELSPVAADPHDATVEALIDLYRTIRGSEHPDWDEYRAAMVAEGRLVVSLHVERVYGQVRDRQ
jgi:PPOX class probable F420-dependent enzyme